MATDSNRIFTSPADIEEIIESSTCGAFQKKLIVIAFLLMALDTINLTIISFAAPAMAVDWKLSPAAFTPVFAAGLVGSLIGAMVLGWVADYFGRRWMIILCVATFGIFTIATPLADSVNSLFIYRFLTGIGLGGMMPNIIAATAEYSPSRLRSLVVSAISCGLPTGSLLAGIIAMMFLSSHGWKSTFYVSGALPVLLVPVLIVAFPESIRFLALKRIDSRELRKVVKKIVPQQTDPDSCRLVIRETKIKGSPVKGLLTDRLSTTLLLWVTFFVSYLVLFLMITWLPSLLREAGIPLERAIVASASFFMGGAVGGIGLAALATYYDPRRVTAGGFLGAFISMATLGMIASHAVVLMLNLFFAGAFVVGAQLTLYAVASASYPTMMRSTGVGWAIGVGRIGSIVGPVVVGLLLSGGMSVATLFIVAAAPGLAGALAAFLLSLGRSGEVGSAIAAVQ